MPTVAKRIPNAPDKIFLTGEPSPIVANMERPKTVKAKYSGGAKLYAARASKGAAAIKQTTEMIPPIVEETAAIPNARPASPRCANGYPSKHVVALADVPGVLIRIAVIAPANVAAQ